MQRYDIAIIGGGIVGCCVARQLARFDVSIAVIEAANDIACGSSKANGGLVHGGYDPAPGSMKAKVNARGCELYSQWAQELGFAFERPGSMVLAFNDEDRRTLERLRAQGKENGVRGLEIVGPERIHELEPRASERAIAALWCPQTGYVDPFDVAISAAENAAANGVDFLRGHEVTRIAAFDDGFEIETNAGSLWARRIVNAAGNGCADISRMAGAEKFNLLWRQGNILVLDREAQPYMPLYPTPTPVSKGVIVTGTVHGNTVITATAAVRKPGDTDTYAVDMQQLLDGAQKLVPSLDTRRVIRAFAGGRAVIEGLNDFLIRRSAIVPGFIQAAGIQSPGVASAPAIAQKVEELLREDGATFHERADYQPFRRPPVDFDRLGIDAQDELIQKDHYWGKIVCRCETVPEAEVIAAIHRTPGAVSVEGVKRRCRAGMGRCQSGFCQSRVVEILARELNCMPEDVLLEDVGSQIVGGPVK